MPTGIYQRAPSIQVEFTCTYCGVKQLTYNTKKRWCSMKCRYADPIYLSEQKARTKNPEWRKQVSRATKEKMRDPVIRERHLQGLAANFAIAKNGNNFSGGKGQAPNQLMLDYAEVLVPLGYQMDTVTINSGKGTYYLLDFALIDRKICIEVDGSSHSEHIERDQQRDQVLRSLGWKVIRIKEW